MNLSLPAISRAMLLQIILLILSYLSFKLGAVTNSLLLYLPLVLGIVFIHWFGWKIFPVLLVNGATTLMIWGVSHFTLRLSILSTHEAVVAVASWFLYNRLFPPKNSVRFGDTDSLLRFVLLGIVLPVCINSIYVYHYGFVRGDLDKVALYWLSDFITILPVSIALLHFIHFDREVKSFVMYPVGLRKRAYAELCGISLIFVMLSLLFPFDKYWFIYGIGATLFALRWGFSAAIILNLIIFLLSYLLPLFDFASSLLITQGSTQFANVHLGMSTMMFVSLVVGRVVSDLNLTEDNLKKEKERVEHVNSDLQQANQELDRFVYSVSHDLSAPLKSIKGLVTISRLEPSQVHEYLNKIDVSVDKLEDFIAEVLEYSRTNRKEAVAERINLPELIREINGRFEFLENSSRIQYSYSLGVETVVADRFLLRVALSNIISNAIKYQKRIGSVPTVAFRSSATDGYVRIDVEDNGEGIRDEYKGRLFSMFYRGTASSSGSGLGLYIAREATQKMGGEISVESAWGQGSTFSITLPMRTTAPHPES